MKSSSHDDSNIKQKSESAPSKNEDNKHLNVDGAAMPHHFSLPRYVDHTYRDFSTYIKDGNKIEKHKKCDRNFPALVHSILSNDQYSHIISWMPHGRAWKIHDKELLMEEIAPKFFGQSKYASFARQLSGWGFKRLHQTGVDFGCYYHECFLRGHPKLTVLMRRVSGGQGKGTPNTSAEPDFYKIAKHFPLVESSDKAGTDDEGAVKKAGAAFSESENIQKTDFLDDFDLDFCLEDGEPQLLRHASDPSVSVSHQHEWDPYQRVGAAHHYPPFPHPQQPRVTPAGADFHEHGDNSTNHHHPTKRDSFASAATDSEADKYDEKVTAKPHHDSRIHDPSLEKCHQQQPRPTRHRERGYSDPFPTLSSSYLDSVPSSGGYHQPYYRPGPNINKFASSEVGRSTLTRRAPQPQAFHRPGPNINQYARSHSSLQRQNAAPVALATAAASPYRYPPPPHYYPQYPPQYHPQGSYEYDHGSNMSNPNYDHRQRDPYPKNSNENSERD